MIFDPLLDVFRGKAITIPPLDGAFRANGALDEAPLFADLPVADNLAMHDGRLIASSGSALYVLSPGSSPMVLQSCAAEVSAIAVSPVGELAIGLDTGTLSVAGRDVALPAGITCITALDFAPDGSLWLANGSARHPPSGWVADLMQKNAQGSVWKSDPGLQTWRKLAGGLAFPYGLLADANGAIVSESWRHRLIRVDGQSGRTTTALAHLPGYPARLAPAPDGGAWLSVFAPRNRLIELVLLESHYRFDMMASVPSEFWIAPALASRRSFLEPLQCGGIRTMGIHKPWAPSRSYGLVVRLNRNMRPERSLHSRADGARHGVCSAIESDGRLFIACKGGDCVLSGDASHAGER